MPEEDILHQADVEEVIVETMGESIVETLEDVSAQATIAALPAPSATYVEAEMLAHRNAINGLLVAAKDAGLIPSA